MKIQTQNIIGIKKTLLWTSAMVLFSVATGAQAVVCDIPDFKAWTKKTIEVVIQHGLEEKICKNNLTPCENPTANELINTVKGAINEFHENSAADINLVYGGRCYLNAIGTRNTSPCTFERNPTANNLVNNLVPFSNTIRKGAISIFAANDCKNANGFDFDFTNGIGVYFDTDGSGTVETGSVTICTNRGGTNNSLSYGSYPYEPNKDKSLQSVLLAGIGGALGLGREVGNCETNRDSIMSSLLDSGHPSRFDIAELQKRFGRRTSQKMNTIASSFWSLGKWLVSGTEPTGDRLRTRFTACDVPVDDGTLLAMSDDGSQLISFLRYGPGGNASFHSALPSNSQGPLAFSSREPAIACKNKNDYRIIYSSINAEFHSPLLNHVFKLFYADSHDGGNSWTEPTLVSDAFVSRDEGVEATWDPASETFIYTTLTRRGDITTQVISDNSPVYGYLSNDLSQQCNIDKTNPVIESESIPTVFEASNCIRAADVASLACGDPVKLGVYNCMIAWTGSGWKRNIKYSKARVINIDNHKKLELEGVKNLDRSSVGSPSLAINYINEPWFLSFHDGSQTATILQANAAADLSSWHVSGTHAYNGAIVSPTIGAYNSLFKFLGFQFRRPSTVISTTEQ